MALQRMLALFIAPALMLPALGQHQNPPDAGGPESGAALFRRYCASCHGRGGEGGRAPSLTGRLHAGETDADVVRVVSSGIPGTDMTSYEARLGSEKIARIVRYIRTVKREEGTLTGDAGRGESIFWGKGGCANCHAAGTRGSRVGPDLSRIGRQRSAGYLRESLLAPEADVVTNFGGIVVTTNDGRRISGIERGLDEFYVVLQDFSGKVHSFERASLRSVSRGGESLMPDYSKTLTPHEVDDLLAYLLTLGAAQ